MTGRRLFGWDLPSNHEKAGSRNHAYELALIATQAAVIYLIQVSMEFGATQLVFGIWRLLSLVLVSQPYQREALGRWIYMVKRPFSLHHWSPMTSLTFDVKQEVVDHIAFDCTRCSFWVILGISLLNIHMFRSTQTYVYYSFPYQKISEPFYHRMVTES